MAQCHCLLSPWLTVPSTPVLHEPLDATLSKSIYYPYPSSFSSSVCLSIHLFFALFSLSLSVVSVEAACDSVDVRLSIHPDLSHDPLSLLNPLSSLQLFRTKQNHLYFNCFQNILIINCTLNNKKTTKHFKCFHSVCVTFCGGENAGLQQRSLKAPSSSSRKVRVPVVPVL